MKKYLISVSINNKKEYLTSSIFYNSHGSVDVINRRLKRIASELKDKQNNTFDNKKKSVFSSKKSDAILYSKEDMNTEIEEINKNIPDDIKKFIKVEGNEKDVI